MRGCITYVSLFLLGLLLLLFLIGALLGSTSSSLIALFIGAIIGLILYSENQRKKRERQRKEEALEQERRIAIVRARSKPNLFTFNPSTDLEDTSNYEQKNNPVKWAEALQKRYQTSTSALNDALIVVNDDIEQLQQFREKLKQGLLKDYELAIRPFKPELLELENEIPKPQVLKAAENYTFPTSLQPANLQKEINSELNSVASGIGNKVSSLITNSNGLKNIKKGEAAITAAAIAIELAIVEVRRRKMSAEKLTEIQALKADVDAGCEEIAGAIKVLGMATAEIQHLKQLHDNAINFLMQHYDAVKNLSEQNSSLDNMNKDDIKTIELFYIAGKQLVRLVHVDVTAISS